MNISSATQYDITCIFSLLIIQNTLSTYKLTQYNTRLLGDLIWVTHRPTYKLSVIYILMVL